MRTEYSKALPDFSESDIVGSPYAIAEYRVAPDLGGDDGLEQFRRALHGRGLRLVLDFVPNHLGMDHPWVKASPDLFVQSVRKVSGVFREETDFGVRWLAHGKDPHFPAWSDTVQLDYRRADTRAVMLRVLQSVARQCDGLRCDMAMLLLNDVFARTWEGFPHAGPVPESEFWEGAIRAVNKANPGFLFLAEVYWGLEPRLQALGFDYTYDKELYDLLMARNAAGVRQHLLALPPEVLARGAHFLENHDERRVASVLSTAEHFAALLVILGLPGLRFLHDGQMTGARERIPVQLARRPKAEQPEIYVMYRDLLKVLCATGVGRGKGTLLEPGAAWPGNPTGLNFVLVRWQTEKPEFHLVAVNLAAHASQCRAPLGTNEYPGGKWQVHDGLNPRGAAPQIVELKPDGFYLDLPAHGAQLLEFAPVR